MLKCRNEEEDREIYNGYYKCKDCQTVSQSVSPAAYASQPASYSQADPASSATGLRTERTT